MAVMPKYANLRELADAYKSGELTAPLMLDNDVTSVCAETGQPFPLDYEDVFEMDPTDLLTQALELLGIPWEHV